MTTSSFKRKFNYTKQWNNECPLSLLQCLLSKRDIFNGIAKLLRRLLSTFFSFMAEEYYIVPFREIKWRIRRVESSVTFDPNQEQMWKEFWMFNNRTCPRHFHRRFIQIFWLETANKDFLAVIDTHFSCSVNESSTMSFTISPNICFITSASEFNY